MASFDELLSGDTEASGHERRSRREKERASKKPRVVRLIALVLVGAAIMAGGIMIAPTVMKMFAGNDFSGAGNGTPAEFAITEGDTGTDIAERLEAAGIVKSSEAVLDELRSRSEEPVFQPGTYTLQLEMSAAAAIDALIDPANRVTGRVVIPEGTAQKQVFELIADSTKVSVEELEATAKDPQAFGLPEEAESLEGFLFPASYEFDPSFDAKAILETMVKRSIQALDEHGVPADRRWDVVRFASLVQREAGLAEDYPKVARVFLNRIDEGMKLQSDATVAYGSGNTHRVTTTDEERADASNEYNTYVHDGLVVKPISNPGDVAIDAAMHPADGKWLFFVTWNLDTGETIFSNTFEEHEVAVAKWQAWMEEHPEYQ